MLDNMSENECHVVIKCKPAAPPYDSWVFYSNIKPANSQLSDRYHVESAEAFNNYYQYKHKLNSSYAVQECPVFERFVEAQIESPIKGYNRASPEPIKDAFRQVTLGQTGIANRLRQTRTQMFSLIPVVVTSAKLISEIINVDNVSHAAAKIQPTDLKPEPRNWLAINYHVSDEAAQFFTKNSIKPTSIAQDISSRLVRTVFVVQAEHIQPFLGWLGRNF